MQHSGDYDYSHQDRTDPNDAWFRAEYGTVWDEKSRRWVDKGVPPPKGPGRSSIPGRPVEQVRVHHAPAPKLPKPVPIEHQPSWVHEHPNTRHVDTQEPQEYTFAPAVWNQKTIDRFEGRNQVVRPGRIDAPPDTTHANVERPPHVDVGPEAPPPQANVPRSGKSTGIKKRWCTRRST